MLLRVPMQPSSAGGAQTQTPSLQKLEITDVFLGLTPALAPPLPSASHQVFNRVVTGQPRALWHTANVSQSRHLACSFTCTRCSIASHSKSSGVGRYLGRMRSLSPAACITDPWPLHTAAFCTVGGTCAPLSAHEQTRFRKRPRVPEPAEGTVHASTLPLPACPPARLPAPVHVRTSERGSAEARKRNAWWARAPLTRTSI